MARNNSQRQNSCVIDGNPFARANVDLPFTHPVRRITAILALRRKEDAHFGASV
jgi:hypothetical protein